MEKVYFSIIVPIYNVEKYIENAIKSIISQSFTNYELILVNDGSTDNSEKICKKYEEIDKRIKVITIENQGSGIARNVGIENSIGKYLYFADPDDILLENALENMYKETLKQEADLYVFGYEQSARDGSNKVCFEKVDEFYTGDEIRKNFDITFKNPKRKIEGYPWNNLFLAEKVKKYDVRYPNLKRKQDIVFLYRYISVISSINFCNICIYRYYVNDTNSFLSKISKDYVEINTIKYRELLETTLKWNEENHLSIINISFYYLDDIWQTFLNTYNPKWNMNKEERKNYIKEIFDKEEVKKAIQYLYDNKNDFKTYLDNRKFNKKSKINFMLKLKIIKSKNVMFALSYLKIVYQIRKHRR